MRISDWSSDVCSSDLGRTRIILHRKIAKPLGAAYNGQADGLLCGPLHFLGNATKRTRKAMTARVFIDGEAGTTGLQIRARLEARDDVRLIRLGEAERKDPAASAHALNEADLANILLPDEEAREAVAMNANPRTRIKYPP